MGLAVILTCYNEGPFIERAVQSVLDQTRADAVAEIVIVDDGSDEDTKVVLRALPTRDPRIRVLYRRNQRVASNRNFGVAETGAELLAFLDGDDYWTPEKLERQLPGFDDPEIGLSYSGYFAFSPNTEAREKRVRDLSREDDQTFSYFLNDPPIVPSTIVVRRAIYEEIGGFDPSVAVFEDTDFYLRLSQKARMKGVPDPLIFKRYRPGSMTSRPRELLAHHAFVTFRFCSREERLLPMAPRRLSDRASRLGMLSYYEQQFVSAAHFARTALHMNRLNPHAWVVLGLSLAGAPLYRLLGEHVQKRARVHLRV